MPTLRAALRPLLTCTMFRTRGKILHDFLRVVLRAVVDEDDLVVRDNGGPAASSGSRAACARRCRSRRRWRPSASRLRRDEALVKRALRIFQQRLQRAVAQLRLALRGDDAEGPVGDVDAVGEPLVGPRKDERAGQAAFEDGGDVLGQQMRPAPPPDGGWYPCRIRSG